MEIILEQQVNQQGALIPDSYLIKQLSGIRVIKDYRPSERVASVGSVINAGDVDNLINAGYKTTFVLPDTFKAPIPASPPPPAP